MELKEEGLASLKKNIAQALDQERRWMLDFACLDRASAEEIYRSFLEEAEEVGRVYGDFDLNKELENPEFVLLLGAGLPIGRAFEAIHTRQLMEQAFLMGAAHSQNDRPGENGLSPQASAATPGSMANSTRAQREEIRSRVRRGETVRL